MRSRARRAVSYSPESTHVHKPFAFLWSLPRDPHRYQCREHRIDRVHLHFQTSPYRVVVPLHYKARKRKDESAAAVTGGSKRYPELWGRERLVVHHHTMLVLFIVLHEGKPTIDKVRNARHTLRRLALMTRRGGARIPLLHEALQVVLGDLIVAEGGGRVTVRGRVLQRVLVVTHRLVIDDGVLEVSHITLGNTWTLLCGRLTRH